jgi:gliding motility-associated-like protein
MSKALQPLLPLLLVLGLASPVAAQNTQVIPFTSGPIPLCDTSIFTANVSGIGTLYPPGFNWWTYSLSQLTMNITSDHPQTLQITLTSPQGTDLLLSAFNGAGGQNYTNTVFMYDAWWPNISTGSAPFTGNWTAQGGGLSEFDYENADGVWTITVVDTACTNTGGGGGGNAWIPGWFDGNAGGNGGFAFGFTGPPPCWGGIPYGSSMLCPGETVDLAAYYGSSGFSITYNDPNWAPVADPTAVSAPGQYWIDAFDPWYGCMYSATYDIYAITPVALGPDQVVEQCAGAAPVDLTALVPTTGTFPTWTFDGSQVPTSWVAAATVPGTYQIINNPGTTCSDTAVVTLSITGGPQLGPDQSTSICAGGTSDLTTLYTTTGMSVAWYFAGSPFATPEAATDLGVYTLIASTNAGCADTAEVTLSVQAQPSLGADQTQNLCSNASLDLTALYTTTGLNAAWTLMGSPVADPAAVTSGGAYQLIASNGAGCADTAMVSVTAIASPTLGADATAAICDGASEDLTTVFTTTGLTTAWTLSGSAVTNPAAVGSTGVYTLVATNATGCSDTANVDVVVSANPALGADQTVTACTGVPVDLTALYNTGADATAWTLNGNAVAIPGAVTDAGNYTLTATNTAGCADMALVTLSLDPAPSLGADQTASICSGSTFDLTAVYSTAGLTSAWTRNNAAVANATAANTSGAYQLVASNSFGCTDTAVVDLAVNANPALGADLSFALCSWQTIDLGAVFPVAGMSATYTMNGQAVVDPAAVYDAGTYSVSVTDANGCTDSAMATVTNVECLCVADFTTDARCMQEPAQFTLLADSAIVGAHWDVHGAATNSAEIDPLLRFTAEGDVLVTLVVTLSCGVDTVERTIHVDDCSDSCWVYVPSAFTPDQDGINDSWTWKGECFPEDFSMEIFDRWGELLYSTNEPWRAWDGTYQGAFVPNGVYAYRVGYRLPYQERKEVKGSIAVLR